MKKYRLCYCAGSFSALLVASYLQTKNDSYENICLFVSYTANEKYIEDTISTIKLFDCYDKILCANFCVYSNSDKNGVMNTSSANILQENPEDIQNSRLDNLLGDIQFSEVIAIHYLSPFTNLLAKRYPQADFFTIEEGLNAYFRKYKCKLSNDDISFIKRWKGHISYNWLNIHPLFNFSKFGIKNIVVKKKYILNTINMVKRKIENQDFLPKSTLIIGQPARDVSENALFELYSKTIDELLQRNMNVYFIKHPRDISSLEFRLSSQYNNRVHFVENKYGIVELLINKNISLVIGHSSTSLLTIKHIFNINCVTIEKIDLKKIKSLKGDHINAQICCSSVLPSFEFITKNNVSIYDMQKKYEDFIPNPGLVRLTYNTVKANIIINYSGYSLYCKSLYEYNNEDFNNAFRSVLQSIRFKPLRLLTYRHLIRILGKRIKKFFSVPVIKKFDIASLAKSPYNEENIKKYIYFLINKNDIEGAFKYNLNLFCISKLNISAYKNYILLLLLKAFNKIKEDKSTIASLIMYMYIYKLKIMAKHVKKDSISSDILSLTFRPNRGATGGPGGVLFLEQQILGNKIASYNHDIIFRKKEVYFDLFADIFSAAQWTYDLILNKSHKLYITHDMGVAFMLALLKRNYIFVWHFQGSFITQFENWGIRMNNTFKNIIKYIEYTSIKNAQNIYFPSIGAKNMYEYDKNRGYKEAIKENTPLYNTIIDNNIYTPQNSITFVSVGTQTPAKGQDNIVDFFDRYLCSTRKNIIWYNIGDGVLYDDTYKKLQCIKSKYDNFSFNMVKKMNHDDVLKLMNNADVYIMLHRISIFDFATLEAMSNRCAIILSRVGGNIEFNRMNNIIFDDNFETDSFEANLEELKSRNFYCYKKFFSQENFKSVYTSEILKNLREIDLH